MSTRKLSHVKKRSGSRWQNLADVCTVPAFVVLPVAPCERSGRSACSALVTSPQLSHVLSPGGGAGQLSPGRPLPTGSCGQKICFMSSAGTGSAQGQMAGSHLSPSTVALCASSLRALQLYDG
jgi:hypothetical protein